TSEVTVAVGVTLELTGTSDTLALHDALPILVLGAGTLSAGGDLSSTTFSGILSGVGGGLTKQGSGLLGLSGINTYSGTTTVSGGTVRAHGCTAVTERSPMPAAGGAN